MIFFSLILHRVLTGDRHSLKVYASLIPIVGGVAIATLTEVSFDIIGLMAALMATAGFFKNSKLRSDHELNLIFSIFEKKQF